MGKTANAYSACQEQPDAGTADATVNEEAIDKSQPVSRGSMEGKAESLQRPLESLPIAQQLAENVSESAAEPSDEAAWQVSRMSKRKSKHGKPRRENASQFSLIEGQEPAGRGSARREASKVQLPPRGSGQSAGNPPPDYSPGARSRQSSSSALQPTALSAPKIASDLSTWPALSDLASSDPLKRTSSAAERPVRHPADEVKRPAQHTPKIPAALTKTAEAAERHEHLSHPSSAAAVTDPRQGGQSQPNNSGLSFSPRKEDSDTLEALLGVSLQPLSSKPATTAAAEPTSRPSTAKQKLRPQAAALRPPPGFVEDFSSIFSGASFIQISGEVHFLKCLPLRKRGHCGREGCVR